MNNLRWMNDAICAEIGSDFFFPETKWVWREAKKVCATCPVKVECLQFARELEKIEGEIDGVWGGTSPADRKALRKQDREAA